MKSASHKVFILRCEKWTPLFGHDSWFVKCIAYWGEGHHNTRNWTRLKGRDQTTSKRGGDGKTDLDNVRCRHYHGGELARNGHEQVHMGNVGLETELAGPGRI